MIMNEKNISSAGNNLVIVSDIWNSDPGLIPRHGHYGKDWIIIPQKCGGIGSNGFYIKWIFGTQDNWKN